MPGKDEISYNRFGFLFSSLFIANIMFFIGAIIGYILRVILGLCGVVSYQSWLPVEILIGYFLGVIIYVIIDSIYYLFLWRSLTLEEQYLLKNGKIISSNEYDLDSQWQLHNEFTKKYSSKGCWAASGVVLLGIISSVLNIY